MRKPIRHPVIEHELDGKLSEKNETTRDVGYLSGFETGDLEALQRGGTRESEIYFPYICRVR